MRTIPMLTRRTMRNMGYAVSDPSPYLAAVTNAAALTHQHLVETQNAKTVPDAQTAATVCSQSAQDAATAFQNMTLLQDQSADTRFQATQFGNQGLSSTADYMQYAFTDAAMTTAYNAATAAKNDLQAVGQALASIMAQQLLPTLSPDASGRLLNAPNLRATPIQLNGYTLPGSQSSLATGIKAGLKQLELEFAAGNITQAQYNQAVAALNVPQS